MDRAEARKRAEELVDRMTVEEMASQLRFDAPAIERLGIPEYNWWNEGLHGVARAGTATMFPQAIALAAAFDEELMRDVGDVISTEGRAKYNESIRHGDRDIYKGLTFWSPNINIFRDPRWGRGHETYGEDPYLTGVLGCAFIRGLQGEGDGVPYLKLAACAKHFAVHSGPEAERHSFDARVSEKDLHETYLPAFEQCVREAHVESVMGAYNRTNGEPCCGHTHLMKEILRGEWQFEGHFVSDCWAVQDFHMHHHVTNSAEESAVLALESGCDVNCGCTYQKIMNAYGLGMVSRETIRDSAVRLFTTRYLLGMFEETPYDAIPYEKVDCAEHRALAVKAARESLVLLKNDGVLPLSRERIRTLAIIGPNADSRRALIGNYHGTASEYVTVLNGIREQAGDDIRILYSEGSHLYLEKGDALAKLHHLISEAQTVAEHADAVVLCLGLDETLEGEEGDAGNADASGDKKDLQLPASQRKLVESVLAVGKPTIVCMLAGSAMDMKYVSERASAILQVWYPGALGGRAVAEALFGVYSPSGKLPITLYRDLDGLPEFTDYSMKGRTYRYLENEPLYPFGYGLSYGKITLKGCGIMTGEAGASGEINVADETGTAGKGVPLKEGSADVLQIMTLDKQDYEKAAKEGLTLYADLRNESGMDLSEVLQVYVRVEESENEVRNHRLCAFRRISLKPGEQKRVALEIRAQAFATVNEHGEYHADGEGAKMFVGFGQPDARTAELLAFATQN
ncbi:MAG: glycoside hydrolase family 3 C-terminal domain-containing protein [Lachnospiraceae bacterium]|nr:glycoside hydrolase family 3 C-terminal domain-containing protein [Lachnospiraceae bacterium]